MENEYLGIDDITDNTKVDDIETEDVNLIFVAIDVSGSMQAYEDVMRKELSNFKNSIKNSKEATQILISRADFGSKIDVSGYKKIDDFNINYNSDGMTLLYDVILFGVNNMLDYMKYLKAQGVRVKAVFSVFSDGVNTAGKTAFVTAKNKIKELKQLEIVTAFISFGAEAMDEAKNLEFQNILQVGQSDSELRKAFSCLSQSIITNSQSIVNNTNNFFQV